MATLDYLYNAVGQENTSLTAENLNSNLTGHFQHYIKLLKKGRFKESNMDQPLAFGEAHEYSFNALTKLGIPEGEITFIYGSKIEECFVKVSDRGIEELKKSIEAYLQDTKQ